MSDEFKQYLPYIIAGLLLMLGLAVGLRLLFRAVAPQLLGLSTTLAWLLTSLVAVAWYATRDKAA